MADVQTHGVALMDRPPARSGAAARPGKPQRRSGAATWQELILRGQRYEPEALAELYDEHFDLVYQYLDARLGDAARAEEMTRRVFLQALESLPRFRRFESGFAPWLFRIANRILAEDVRTESVLPESPLPEGAPRAAVLRQAIRSLTPEQAEVLSLRVIARMSVPQIAQATGRRIAAVEALQHRSLLGLRQALERPEPV